MWNSLASQVDFARCDLIVGVIDGIPDRSIAALEGCRLDMEMSMIPADWDAPDSHGTEICSLIFGNSESYTGLAPGCRGIALPVFFGRDTGKGGFASQMDIARAITIGLERGAAIINISAGQKASTAEAGRHLEDALARCEKKGVLVVAAAGNDGCECLHVPAAVHSVIAVGAMDTNGMPHDRSNWGDAYRSNGLMALGVGVKAMSLDGKIVERTGTSYAAAIVTAVAAQLLCESRDAGYAMTALDIRQILFDSADPCADPTDESCARILSGKLNVAKARQLLHERAEASETTPLSTPSSISQQTFGRETMSETTDAQPAVAAVEPPAPPAGAVVTQTTELAVAQSAAIDVAPVGEPPASALAAASRTRSDSLVAQSACGCGGSAKPEKVYVIGSLWYDFGTEARYDALVQAMGSAAAVADPSKLLTFLSENPEYATGITFTLMQDQIPVYAVHPGGIYAAETYKAIFSALKATIGKGGELKRVSIGGLMSGTTRLMNGAVLPVIFPDLRSMTQWDTKELISSCKAAMADKKFSEDNVLNFLVRVYDELRNLGISADERAINYAATNAYQAAASFADAASKELALYSIDVVKSPICRPDSDCWDVQLKMFDPENERRAGWIYRFIVDVSEVLPVTVGQVRKWAAPVSTF